MMAVEVAHADELHLTLSHIVLHHLPGIFHTVLYWPMYQQQVDVVGLQLSQTLVDRLSDSFSTFAHDVHGDLRCEENLLSRHPAINDTLTYLCFILIALCCVVSPRSVHVPTPICGISK